MAGIVQKLRVAAFRRCVTCGSRVPAAFVANEWRILPWNRLPAFANDFGSGLLDLYAELVPSSSLEQDAKIRSFHTVGTPSVRDTNVSCLRLEYGWWNSVPNFQIVVHNARWTAFVDCVSCSVPSFCHAVNTHLSCWKTRRKFTASPRCS